MLDAPAAPRVFFASTGAAAGSGRSPTGIAMKHKQRGFKRSERVSQQLHEFLSTALLTDVQDPRVADVQITEVDVSPNLRHARAYYVLLDSRPFDATVQKALDGVASLLKRRIGAELHFKYTPELVFTYDESVERGRRIDELLAGLKET